MVTEKRWFTEEDVAGGTAFSLRLTAELHRESTPFQEIAVYETETFGRLMVIDGCVMLSTRDNFIYHEMMAHPVLFSHPRPRRVVIIGGGDCGTLTEVLKHSAVEEVIQVEIDERVTRLSEHFFPELCRSNPDPRAHFQFTDGVRWMEDARAGSVDIVIVDSTDPVGPGEGLFNGAFYSSCLKALGEQGMLVQQSESPLLHRELFLSIADTMRAAGFNTTRALHFPQPVYPSGWWSATLAGKQAIPRDPLSQRGLGGLTYYTPDIHRAALAQPAFLLPPG